MAKVTVRKGNVLLDIENDPVVVERYQALGYSLLDERGRPIPKETQETKLLAELEAVKAQNKALVLENTDLKAKLEALLADVEPEVVEEAIPKKKRSAKKN